jgi:hypothetical protein
MRKPAANVNGNSMKSSPVLNVFVIIVGGLLFISGIMKAIGMLSSFELHAGDIAIKIPNSMSLFYIITVNLMGGGAMLHHAIATLRFKRNLVDEYAILLQSDPENAKQSTNLSKLSIATAIYSIIISLWLLLRTIVLLSGFDSPSFSFFPLGIMIMVMFLPFTILPLLLIGKNLALSSKLGQIIDNKSKAELRAKIQSTRRVRR